MVQPLPLLLRDEMEMPVLPPIIRGKRNDHIVDAPKPWTIAAASQALKKAAAAVGCMDRVTSWPSADNILDVSEETVAQWMSVSGHIEPSAFGFRGGGHFFFTKYAARKTTQEVHLVRQAARQGERWGG